MVFYFYYSKTNSIKENVIIIIILHKEYSINMQGQFQLSQNTENKEEKIKNLNVLINELEIATGSKRRAFLDLLEQLRNNPNEQSYIELKNLLQSFQPVLCNIASKVTLFENDSFATNNPQIPLLSPIKNESVTELQESTKLQIEQIDIKTIRCTYETYNTELAKQMFKINESVDFCISQLMDKFETFIPQKTNNIDIEKV